MRTPQCKAEKVGRECYPGPPRRSPRRASAGRSAGGALRKAPVPGAWCPAQVPQAEGDNRPTIIRGPVATEHLQSDRHAPGRGQARAKLAPAGGWLDARHVARATAGVRPAAAKGGGLERGRRQAPTRTPHLWSERSERNRRGAQPRGWEGVGPQAVGCGLLLGSRGHPIPFAVIAQQAPCGRCIGRPAGAKRKRANPCGLALFEVRTLSRAALVGAPLLYHNQPLLSRPAVQFFGCR